MTTDWDAIVIGAGPAGSVAAHQIARRGLSVLLLDKKRFPRRKVCGACLNHSAITLLEDIGLGDVLQEHRVPALARFEVHAMSRRLSLPLPSGVAISRATLDQRLVEAAVRAGAMFEDGVSATVGSANQERRFVKVRESHADVVPKSRTLTSKVVIAADGLGHPSLCDLPRFHDRIGKRSRLGASCEVTTFPSDYQAGVIYMAVGRGGYVGLVGIETNALNIAAAFDAELVRDAGGLAPAAVRILAEAGVPAIPAMFDAEWLGTPALTRATSPVACERLFVLGDAAGYVEPFTGEGIGWALSSAVAMAPLAQSACESWHPALVQSWSRQHTQLVRRRQWTCRMLAALLKHPIAVRSAISVLPWMPRLLQPLVRGVSLPKVSPLAPDRCR